MPIAFVLQEQATVAHAAAMMSLEDTHHVLVVRSSGELVGVVSSKDVVEWLVTNDELKSSRSAEPQPEVVSPAEVQCRSER